MNKLWRDVAVVAVASAASMIGFWMVNGREYTSRAEVREMIEVESPYTRERKFVIESLAMSNETRRDLTAAINRNSEVINDLKVELALLRGER